GSLARFWPRSRFSLLRNHNQGSTPSLDVQSLDHDVVDGVLLFGNSISGRPARRDRGRKAERQGNEQDRAAPDEAVCQRTPFHHGVESNANYPTFSLAKVH